MGSPVELSMVGLMLILLHRVWNHDASRLLV